MLQLSFCTLLELNSQTHPRRQELICSLTYCSTELFFPPCITYQWQVHWISNQAVIHYSLGSSWHSDLYHKPPNTAACRAPAFPTPPSQPLLLSGQAWTQPTAQRSAQGPGNSVESSFPAGMRLLFLLSAPLLNPWSEGYQSNRRLLSLSTA